MKKKVFEYHLVLSISAYTNVIVKQLSLICCIYYVNFQACWLKVEFDLKILGTSENGVMVL